MKLHPEYYLPRPPEELVDPAIGLPGLCKGLNSILLGYLLSVTAVFLMGGVIWYLIDHTAGKSITLKAAEEASTVLFAAGLLFGLAMIGSLLLIVRGKWTCLLSAPEHYHAKWLMFMSIVCILTGPALNLGLFLVGDSKADPKEPKEKKTTSVFVQEIEKYKQGMPALDTRGYIKLAGQAVGMFSGIFFVLFLRAIALCWGAQGRVRAAELYLVLVAMLAVGGIFLFWKPAFMLTHPQLLIGLFAGCLIAGIWYLCLILSTVAGLHELIAHPPRQESALDYPAPGTWTFDV